MSIFLPRLFWLPTAQRMPSLLPQLLWMWLTAIRSELHVVYVKQLPYVSGAVSYWSGVPSGYPYTDPELEHDIEQQARKLLDAEVEEVRSAGGEVAEAHLRIGTAAREIVALAEDIEAGLIVMGSRGLGG